MKRRLNGMIGLTLLALGGWWLSWQLTPKPIEIEIARVEKGLVERSVANTRAGAIKACRRARLTPSMGGQIAALYAKEGDRVMKNELLLELWNLDHKAEVMLAEQQINASDASAKAACFTAEEAQRDANRLTRLHRQGVASEEQTDQAGTIAKARQADCEAALSQVGVARAKHGVAQANLQRTQLFAPFEGVVAEVNGERNEYVTPSPPGIPTLPVFDLLDDACFYVSAPIDEVDAAGIKTGMPTRISLDAFGEKRFNGQVRRIACYVLDREKQARTVEVEAVFSDANDMLGLLAGYSADLEIILDQRPDGLRIPTEALQEGNRVLLYQPDSQTLVERQVTTGLSNWKFTEIRQGLQTGDQVVLSLDKEGVEAGARVRINIRPSP
jgi:HlyD family secretion protein